MMPFLVLHSYLQILCLRTRLLSKQKIRLGDTDTETVSSIFDTLNVSLL